MDRILERKVEKLIVIEQSERDGKIIGQRQRNRQRWAEMNIEIDRDRLQIRQRRIEN